MLTASACSGAAATTGGPPLTSIAPPATATPGPPALRLGLCLDTVPAGARCGTLAVPLDYADPSKGAIRIRVISVPAKDPTHRIGSLLVNPGGPGASGVRFVEEAISLFATLNQRFDIVGFDPRGTADPNPVSCEDTAALDHVVAVDPIVDDPSEQQDLIATSERFAQACQQKSGALLPYVGTDNVARDMDALRAALGDNKLTYLGFSYGSAIGTQYSALYPTHIRALALDGDIDPSTDLLLQGAQQADGFQRNYQEFLARCAAQSSCPLGPDPNAAIITLLSNLDAHPVPVPDGRTVGRGVALLALAGSLYDPGAWSALYSVWARAVHGDVTGLLAVSDAYTGRQPGGYDHSLESGTAITCVDQATPTDIATLEARVAPLQTRDPLFGGAALYGLLPCAYWPVRGQPAAPVDITAAPPILLVGGTNDPATPYVWAQALHRQIRGSVLLTRDGFGHPSYDHSACIAAKVDAYLVDGILPAAGTVCSS
ncbi:MAG TPA: alpha/beta hydrolase [Candidatus Dormibacteraeota bacterium]